MCTRRGGDALGSLAPQHRAETEQRETLFVSKNHREYGCWSTAEDVLPLAPSSHCGTCSGVGPRVEGGVRTRHSIRPSRARARAQRSRPARAPFCTSSADRSWILWVGEGVENTHRPGVLLPIGISIRPTEVCGEALRAASRSEAWRGATGRRWHLKSRGLIESQNWVTSRPSATGSNARDLRSRRCDRLKCA
jgi:hypothetical protein